jgi:hypothetical protein
MKEAKQNAINHLKSDLNFLKSKGFDPKKILIKEKIISQIEDFLKEKTLSEILEDYLNEDDNYPGAIPVNEYYMVFPIWIKRETVGDYDKRALDQLKKHYE